MHTVLIVLELIFAIAMITLVLLQPSKTDGFKGFLTGNSDTFYSRNKSRTKEALLARLTVADAALFAIVTVLLNIVK